MGRSLPILGIVLGNFRNVGLINRHLPQKGRLGGILSMIALLTRVSRASVVVDRAEIASIGAGLLVLVGIEQADGTAQAERLAERLLAFRIFEDGAQRMNLSVATTGGQVLLVPQFTLAADTSRGNRPGFEPAAAPDRARMLFEHLAATLLARGTALETGRFGARMEVESVNSGPATFLLHVAPDPPTNSRRA
jgi:D-aminoacyl-tRNA deacylase